MEKKIINDYITARKRFIEKAKQFKNLEGNDNIIGRIGEYIAISYLDSVNRSPIKAKRKNQTGYDLLCDNGKTTISVKLLTKENKAGRSTKINLLWDELMLIVLDDNYKVEKIGIITKNQYLLAQINNDFKSSSLYTSKAMLYDNGLIGKYGCIIGNPDILSSLL